MCQLFGFGVNNSNTYFQGNFLSFQEFRKYQNNTNLNLSGFDCFYIILGYLDYTKELIPL